MERIEMKFIDGTPVPDEYRKKINQLVEDACKAEESVSLDELEEKRPLCSVCGKPALNMCQDSIKVVDSSTNIVTLLPYDPPHIRYGCNEHPVEPRVRVGRHSFVCRSS